MDNQNYEDLRRCLSTIVTNAKLVPDPAMEGTTDLYGVPLDDIADAGELLERLQNKQIEDAPAKRVIEDCNHSKSRMIEWADDGACPICLTADAGMRREDVSTLLAALKMARAEIVALAEIAVHRIIQSGGSCDPAESTYGPIVKRIGAVIAKAEGTK